MTIFDPTGERLLFVAFFREYRLEVVKTDELENEGVCVGPFSSHTDLANSQELVINVLSCRCELRDLSSCLVALNMPCCELWPHLERWMEE